MQRLIGIPALMNRATSIGEGALQRSSRLPVLQRQSVDKLIMSFAIVTFAKAQ
jgi:hypothetical protein